MWPWPLPFVSCSSGIGHIPIPIVCLVCRGKIAWAAVRIYIGGCTYFPPSNGDQGDYHTPTGRTDPLEWNRLREVPGDGAAKSRKIVTKRLCGKFAMRVSGVPTYLCAHRVGVGDLGEGKFLWLWGSWLDDDWLCAWERENVIVWENFSMMEVVAEHSDTWAAHNSINLSERYHHRG